MQQITTDCHTLLTRSYLLNKEQPSTCDHCKCLLTVEHILTKCIVYKQVREKNIINILSSLTFSSMSNFLHEIKLFNKL